MERMLVIVFDTEKKAYEGLQALNKLDREGSIAIHSETVIQKNADGTITMKQADGDFPVRTIAGTAIGSFIGLLGGPVGVAAGAGLGFSAGFISDAYSAEVNSDFLLDVSTRLTPGKFAVLADVSEEWVTPVDSTMEALGGVVFRSAKANVEAEQRARNIAQFEKDIEQLEAEYERAEAAFKAELRVKIDNLKKKRDHQVEQAKLRAETLKKEVEAKVHALQQKAAKANRETKAVIEARIAEIREQHELREAKLRNATAAKLRAAAAKLEKAG